jgi:NTP pyrophosphatase (non-canonical NTP hydrolase)
MISLIYLEKVMSYAQTEIAVIQWAESRKIIPNASSSTQLIKAFSELGECGDELIKGNREAMKMELGDVMVTLVIFAALENVDLCECMDIAYRKIKTRKGTMLPNGVFVKDEA